MILYAPALEAVSVDDVKQAAFRLGVLPAGMKPAPALEPAVAAEAAPAEETAAPQAPAADSEQALADGADS